MHDHDNPPLTPKQQRIEQLTETVTAFVGLNAKVDVAKVRRFLGAIRTGDPDVDREVRANAEVVVTLALARGTSAGARTAGPGAGDTSVGDTSVGDTSVGRGGWAWTSTGRGGVAQRVPQPLGEIDHHRRPPATGGFCCPLRGVGGPTGVGVDWSRRHAR